ncbi:MAG: hypothetical protein PHS38_14905 [Bacteroidales bacterium]|nr:hypothetical protein [Bacteroidales bacterium]
MEDGGLSRLDAWHLENVIFRLYKVIANCYVLCTQYVQKDLLTPETWMEKDRKIAGYFREPQRYEYGEDVNIELSGRTFEKLHEFIIERNDFELALDFVQPKLHLNFVIKTMKKVETHLEESFSSMDFVVTLRDFRAEVYKWAAVYALRIHSSMEQEMAKRKCMTYSLLCEANHYQICLQEEAGHYPMAGDKGFELADFFNKDYDAGRIARIYQFLRSLNEQKGASYTAKMASVVAVAWENSLLCETYNNTLQAVFDHFGISDKTENFKPSRFRRPNYKGTPPLVRVQALKFFQSLDTLPF